MFSATQALYPSSDDPSSKNISLATLLAAYLNRAPERVNSHTRTAVCSSHDGSNHDIRPVPRPSRGDFNPNNTLTTLSDTRPAHNCSKQNHSLASLLTASLEPDKVETGSALVYSSETSSAGDSTTTRIIEQNR